MHRLTLITLALFLAGCRDNGATGVKPEAVPSSVHAPSSAPIGPKADVASTSSGDSVLPKAEEAPTRKSEQSRCNVPFPAAPRIKEVFATARQLKSAAELESFVSKGKAGKFERIAIQVQGAFGAGCECPPFSAWFTNPDESFQPILTIPRAGAIDIGLSRPNLRAILIGYFSGANVDTYEYFQALGQTAPTPDDEERHTWLETHPEFCLETLCYALPDYRIDPEDGDAGADYVRFLQGVSAEGAASYAKQGIMKCKSEWLRSR